MFGTAPLDLDGPRMSASPDNGPDRLILPLPEPENPPITEIDARKATPPPRFELKPPKGAGAPNVVCSSSGAR
jgi:hypothetical protein